MIMFISNYRLKGEASFAPHYWPVWIKSCCVQSYYENYGWFPFRIKGNPSRAMAKSTPYVFSEDEWDTKEDPGKSIKNVFYVLRYVKRHFSGRRDVEWWKNRARNPSRYRVMLDWRHQSVTYSVSQKKILLNRKILKSCSNFLEAFRVNLKAFLGFVLPNQYGLIVAWEDWSWFSGDFTSLATHTALWPLLYTTRLP